MQRLGCVDHNDKFVIIKVHNHNKLTNKINRLKFNNKIISDSLFQIKTATDIITSNTAALSNADLKSISDYKSLNDKISRIRNKKFKDSNMNFDDILDKFKINLRKETFLQYDSRSADNQKVLIFYSQYTIDLLTKTRYTLIDGTFWSVPTLFTQLLTIFGSAFGKSISLVFVLLASKEKEIYINAFSKLKELTGCHLTNVVVDFEIGLKNSVQLVFPKSHIFRCSFHFGQMI
ncbi:hypothetical protein CDIK_2441 [Cucumispora dikerogammari]|nr:hypothetical protein CDIK_2441 [Cucumispora dikerogammari]